MKTIINKTDLYLDKLHLNPINLTLSKLDGQSVQFTRREFQVFHFLANNLNRIVNKYILMDLIWDIGNFSNSNALEVHLSSLRKKLNQINSHLTIKTLRGVGYSLKCL